MSELKRESDQVLLEAVDCLSEVVDLDITKEGTLQKGERQSQVIKEKFLVIHDFLKGVWNSKETPDETMAKGVRSIIRLANEAAEKLDQIFLASGIRDVKISQSKELLELTDFYKKKLKKRFDELLEAEEKWHKEWMDEDFDPVDIQRKGLRDLEIVTKDKHYELFFLTKEDGTRFYNKNLLRHIRLVVDFETLLMKGNKDDPIIKIQKLKDQISHQVAQSIKKRTYKQFKEWLKAAVLHKKDRIVHLFYESYMALTFAADSRHSIGEGSAKSCGAYFSDFQHYLRELLTDPAYEFLIDNPPPSRDLYRLGFLDLVHETCMAIFSHRFAYEKALSFIYRTIGKALRTSKDTTLLSSHLAMFHEVMEIQEKLGEELKKYPSGPLFRAIEIFQELEEHTLFDPYLLRNIGSWTFDLSINKQKIAIHLLPCPTMQKKIDEAKIIPECKGMLRALMEQKPIQKALWVNLQDRTTLEEYARCKELEKLVSDAEFKPFVSLLSLPISSPFYLQSSDYLELSDSKSFKKVFLEQLRGGKECGYIFPVELEQLGKNGLFMDLIEAVEKVAFKTKKELSRKNRLDWIELVHNLLILKSIELLSLSEVAFISKDGIDIGAVTMAAFYGFMKMVDKKSKWNEAEKDFFIAITFFPALLERERLVDSSRLNRTISALSVVASSLEMAKGEIGPIEALFSTKFFKELSLKPSADLS